MTKEEILRKHFAKPSKIGREFQNTYDAMEEYAQSLLSEKWISAEERLPEAEGKYLCCKATYLHSDNKTHYSMFVSNFHFYRDARTNEKVVHGDGDTGCFQGNAGYSDVVDYYMPLPSPPTK